MCHNVFSFQLASCPNCSFYVKREICLLEMCGYVWILNNQISVIQISIEFPRLFNLPLRVVEGESLVSQVVRDYAGVVRAVKHKHLQHVVRRSKIVQLRWINISCLHKRRETITKDRLFWIYFWIYLVK